MILGPVTRQPSSLYENPFIGTHKEEPIVKFL